MEEEIKLIKLCKICQCDLSINIHKGKQCRKCISKANNKKLNERDYYKNYWLNNKNPDAKRGRPVGSKNREKNIIEIIN